MLTIKTPQGWARAGLITGAALSILGNVTNTVLTPSDVSLGQTVPLAIVWPAALFLAAEILVRVPWRNKLLDWIGRAVLLPVAAVTAIVSYLHIHHFMVMSGEVSAAAVLGPLGVDGLMMGSTIALLSIRNRSIAAEVLEAKPEPIAPLVASSIPAIAATPRTHSKPRSASPALADAVKLLLSGEEPEVVAAKVEAGVSTVRRYVRAIRLIREDPARGFDAKVEKIRPELLDAIRTHIAAERSP